MRRVLQVLCVISVCFTVTHSWINGVLPLVDVVSLGSGPTYTLLLVNIAKVVVEHLGATSYLSYDH